MGGVGVGAVVRALPAHCCCCGGRRRGVRGPCGVLPSLARRAGVAAWPAEAVSRPAGVAAAVPRASSSLSFAAVAAADEAPLARAGSAPRFRGVLGAAAWSAEAVVRPAGAAVATPRAPSSFSSAAAAAAGEAPVARAGSVPRVRGVPGVAARQAEAGARRGSLGLRSLLPARLGPPLGAGRRGWLLGWRKRSSRLAQAPGPEAAAQPAPPPPPASAPRAPRGSPPSTPGRRQGSGSGTGGCGGRPAGGTHRSLPSLLPW